MEKIIDLTIRLKIEIGENESVDDYVKNRITWIVYDYPEHGNDRVKEEGHSRFTELGKIICTKCGGKNVSCDAVINPNTKEFLDYGSEAFLYGFCEKCEEGSVLTDTNEVIQRIQSQYDEYLKDNRGQIPKVASCQIVWKNDNKIEDVRIKLGSDNHNYDEEDDIFFYSEGLSGLKSLADFCGEDFIVTWIYSFQ